MANLCPSCGASNRDSARYCQVCSHSLLTASAVQNLQLTSSFSQPGLANAVSAGQLVADSGITYLLRPPLMKIGRAPDNDLVLTNHQTSSYHATIRIQNGQYTLFDNGSTNGTYRNGQLLTNPATLTPGDRIAFGPEKFTWQMVGTGTVLMSGSPPATSHVTNWSPSFSHTPNLPAGTGAAAPINTSRWWGAQLVGYVTHCVPLQQEQVPTDPAHVMVMVAVSLGFVGVLLNFAIFAFTVGILLLICGGAALLFILPFLLMPFQMLYSGLMGWLKDDKPVMACRFSVTDEQNQMPVDVLLFLKPGKAGNILLGDRVMVWGSRQSATIRATKAMIIERNGQTTHIPIQAKKPWPIWIGFAVLITIFVSLLYLAVSLGLIPV